MDNVIIEYYYVRIKNRLNQYRLALITINWIFILYLYYKHNNPAENLTIFITKKSKKIVFKER